MKLLSIIIPILVFSTSTFSQTQFNIIDTTISGSYKEALKNLNIVKDSVFYEDAEYIVRSTCSGEWGGSVWFKNKETGLVHSCAATCPLVVNKVDGKYIVTATLAHLIGSCRVIEISNPDSMEIFKNPKPRNKRGKRKFFYVGDHESKSQVGTNMLADSFGVLIVASFVHDNQLMHIMSSYDHTYVCKVEANHFVMIDTICEGRLPIKRREILRTEDGAFVIPFDPKETKGFLEIRGSDIFIRRYE
ncbi:MAG: hypothetical protein AB8F95_02785 [Bacteroidia bacterium]